MPPMAIQYKIGELNKRARALNAHHAVIRANNAVLLAATLERMFNQGGRGL